MLFIDVHVLQVLYSYSIGFVYILLGLLSVGGIGPAVSFCSQVGFNINIGMCSKIHIHFELRNSISYFPRFRDIYYNISIFAPKAFLGLNRLILTTYLLDYYM